LIPQNSTRRPGAMTSGIVLLYAATSSSLVGRFWRLTRVSLPACGYPRRMPSRILAVVVDCQDAGELTTFWCAALGYDVLRRWQDADGLTYVELGADGRPMLLLQPVPDVGCCQDVT
jgi:hypothetical protein